MSGVREEEREGWEVGGEGEREGEGSYLVTANPIRILPSSPINPARGPSTTSMLDCRETDASSGSASQAWKHNQVFFLQILVCYRTQHGQWLQTLTAVMLAHHTAGVVGVSEIACDHTPSVLSALWIESLQRVKNVVIKLIEAVFTVTV